MRLWLIRNPCPGWTGHPFAVIRAETEKDARGIAAEGLEFDIDRVSNEIPELRPLCQTWDYQIVGPVYWFRSEVICELLVSEGESGIVIAAQNDG